MARCITSAVLSTVKSTQKSLQPAPGARGQPSSQAPVHPGHPVASLLVEVKVHSLLAARRPADANSATLRRLVHKLRCCGLLLFAWLRRRGSATRRGSGSASGRGDRLAGKAEAVVPLLGLLELWDQVDDRTALAQLLDEVRGDPRQLNEVRARATSSAFVVSDRLWRSPKAKAERDSLGLVTVVVGGGSIRQRRAERLRARYPARSASPSTRPRTIPARSAPVSWRRFPEQVASRADAARCRVPPRSGRGGLCPHLGRVPRAVDVAARLGIERRRQAVGQWASRPRPRGLPPGPFDQERGARHLNVGWNQLLVKLAAVEGGWALMASG